MLAVIHNRRPHEARSPPYPCRRAGWLRHRNRQNCRDERRDQAPRDGAGQEDHGAGPAEDRAEHAEESRARGAIGREIEGLARAVRMRFGFGMQVAVVSDRMTAYAFIAHRIRQLLPGLLLFAMLAGCSSLPVLHPDMSLRRGEPVQLEGARGPLSAQRSKEILD